MEPHEIGPAIRWRRDCPTAWAVHVGRAMATRRDVPEAIRKLEYALWPSHIRISYDDVSTVRDWIAPYLAAIEYHPFSFGDDPREEDLPAPCPFCGATRGTLVRTGYRAPGVDTEAWHVRCLCGAQGPQSRNGWRLALARWATGLRPGCHEVSPPLISDGTNHSKV